ncbi:Uncharacterised protein [Mycobacterium tuberculosis]|uniref:Uncharacterized protein n=1 Tax=Mycobacterium tuberculosis TaxID=1773 RepID=A0A655FYM0_MYCTX|nr:Uncharacterised protein [Mycobacterium tuberculosis]CNW51491.1 Uncharacterised protein [Mycobacterium tuberculosis]
MPLRDPAIQLPRADRRGRLLEFCQRPQAAANHSVARHPEDNQHRTAYADLQQHQ